ncbi:MAG: hypothetical protein LBN05_06130 [Oscillospiraceae bacterium]|nr:hypothetical protein [Oscillospiraceae bacterium]
MGVTTLLSADIRAYALSRSVDHVEVYIGDRPSLFPDTTGFSLSTLQNAQVTIYFGNVHDYSEDTNASKLGLDWTLPTVWQPGANFITSSYRGVPISVQVNLIPFDVAFREADVLVLHGQHSGGSTYYNEYIDSLNYDFARYTPSGSGSYRIHTDWTGSGTSLTVYDQNHVVVSPTKTQDGYTYFSLVKNNTYLFVQYSEQTHAAKEIVLSRDPADATKISVYKAPNSPDYYDNFTSKNSAVEGLQCRVTYKDGSTEIVGVWNLTNTLVNENKEAYIDLSYGDVTVRYDYVWHPFSDAMRLALPLVVGQQEITNLVSGNSGKYYFSFTPMVSGSYKFSGVGYYTQFPYPHFTDPVAEILDASGKVLKKVDDTGSSTNFNYSMQLTTGETYYVRLWDYFNETSFPFTNEKLLSLTVSWAGIDPMPTPLVDSTALRVAIYNARVKGIDTTQAEAVLALSNPTQAQLNDATAALETAIANKDNPSPLPKNPFSSGIFGAISDFFRKIIEFFQRIFGFFGF